MDGSETFVDLSRPDVPAEKQRVLPTARECAVRAYNYAYQRDPERASEFFLSFEPVAQRMLERYRPQPGKSFEHYLLSVIAHRWKSFRADTARGFSRRLIIDRTLRPTEHFDDELNLVVFAIRPKGIALRGTVFAALACNESLTDQQLRTIEGESGKPIYRHLAKLRSLREGSRERADLLRLRRDKAYCAMLYNQGLVQLETDPERRAEYVARASKARKTAENARNRLAHVQLGPSHAQLAGELSVPKGTIDSYVYTAVRFVQSVISEGGNAK